MTVFSKFRCPGRIPVVNRPSNLPRSVKSCSIRTKDFRRPPTCAVGRSWSLTQQISILDCVFASDRNLKILHFTKEKRGKSFVILKILAFGMWFVSFLHAENRTKRSLHSSRTKRKIDALEVRIDNTVLWILRVSRISRRAIYSWIMVNHSSLPAQDF